MYGKFVSKTTKFTLMTRKTSAALVTLVAS